MRGFIQALGIQIDVQRADVTSGSNPSARFNCVWQFPFVVYREAVNIRPESQIHPVLRYRGFTPDALPVRS
jgi:hypothetical protein